MAKNKKTMKNFIVKLLTYIIGLFIWWAVGTNFVHLIGRSKPNKENKYSPGQWDWPHNCFNYPYMDKDPLDNLGVPKDFKKQHDLAHQAQVGGKKGKVKKTWTNELEKQFNKLEKMMARKTPKNRRRVRKNKSFKRQRGGDKRDVDHSTPNTPGFLHAHDPDGNIMVTADPVVDSQPVDPNAVVVEAKPVESDEQQKAQMKALQAAEEKAQPEFDDKPTSFAENILGDSGDSGDNLKKIFSNKYLEQNGGFGGHSVDSHDVSLFEEWKNKIKENFTDLEIMRALIETSNKSVEDAYDWLKKAKKENDPRLKRPLPEPLGRPTGPYMLYTPASTDQYGWPYNLQQDGRYSTSTSSSNCNETKKDGGASYSDATVFGANINLKREMGLRTSNNKPKQKTSPASDTKAPPASDR
ncbi:MAG: hypothetical protein CMG00_07605, partial [Candidatus Marinimicrobia bacterium]|nr:hypothetical protein [Candidatus Neomarinimicrobiota bacterium]